MDEEILARLLTFNKDVYLTIFLNTGRKAIFDSKNILAGKIEGEELRDTLKIVREMEEKDEKIRYLKDRDLYIEKIDIKRFLNFVDIPDETITINEALKKDAIFVDVRSPREYKEKTIPGAINIPLFLDKDYELIGRIYKNEGKDRAIDIAVEIINKNLSRILNEVKKLDKDKEIIVFCARGGLRSRVMALILKLLGYKVKRLIGGYKSYRHVEK
ncbi:selenouridine synthase SelU-like subunit [Methanocaldococcus sp.]